MGSERFPIIGGRRMRLTRLDFCGNVAYGDTTQLVSKGFVSVAVKNNYKDGTEVSVLNAAGEECVHRDAEPEFINQELDLVFCDVDPDLYTAITGQPKIVDPATGEVIGFKVNKAVKPARIKNALEVWADAYADQSCDSEDEVPYGYFLWPFLKGARISDYTIADGAVSFGVSGALTQSGGTWAEGPYLVQLDGDGDPSPLVDPIDTDDHSSVFRTVVAPPEVTDGLVPLDNPDDPDATEATAGSPGTFDGVRPFDLAALQASSIDASPATAWTAGQYVVLGDGSLAHWTASAWAAGKA